MFIRTLTSKYILSLIKYTGCVLILACLVFNHGFAKDLSEDTPIPNLSGNEDINIKTYTLTLYNTADSEYSGILSGSGQVIKTGSQQLTLSPESGYADLTGPVTVQEGTLNLAAANIFTGFINPNHLYSSNAAIINYGTIIINANQVLPNLEGNGNIQINGNNILTLSNTVSSEFSGDISGSGQIIITKPKWDSTAQLKLSKEGGYTNFTGSVTIQASESTENASHAEGVLLTAANIFYKASGITNDGTLIVSASQVLPNLKGSGEIQIDSGVNTLTFNNTGDTDYAGSITGTTNLIKTGAGKLTLSHDNGFPSFTGSITVEEGALILEAWNMFRISPPTVTNNAKIMVGGDDQVFKNLSGSGDIEIEANTDLISIYEKDCIISGRIYGNGEFEKQGKGTLTLSGANALTGYIKIDQGRIIFKGDAIGSNEEILGRENGEVEIYTEGTKSLYIPDKSKEILVKAIEKTGDRDSILQIYEGSTGCISAESFVISSGHVDYGGYFQSIADSVGKLGIFDVRGGTSFSPGLTVDNGGEVVDTIGSITITNEATLTIEKNALILFEFDVYSEELYLNNEELFLQTFDRVIFQHENSTFVAANSTIDLKFLNNDVSEWAKKDNEYWIVDDHGFMGLEEDEIVNLDNWLRDKYKDYFSLEGRYNGLYLVGKGAPVLLVPEPSSWILLLGSMVTFLMYLRKKQG